MGVSYDVRIHVGEGNDDYQGTKKSSVHMGIRKVLIRSPPESEHSLTSNPYPKGCFLSVLYGGGRST